jgi:site-specific recombinase XerD
VQSYCRALRDAQAYIDADANELTTEELMEFLSWRKELIGSAALNTIVCALKYYYGKVSGQPEKVIHIPIPRKPSQLGELLTAKELSTLISTARGVKHKLVIELLFGLGLRAGEIGKIRLGDFDRKHRTITIRNAKGKKTRVAPYDEHLRTTMTTYFRKYQPTDYFITSGTKPSPAGITARGVQYIVRETRKRAGLRKKICPHTLRHCFAVHYLNNGGNLIRLKQLLGHACMDTTLRYLSYASIPLRDIPSPLYFLYVSE